MLAIQFVFTAFPAWMVSDRLLKRARLKSMFRFACLLYFGVVALTIRLSPGDKDDLWGLILGYGFLWGILLASSALAVFAYWGDDPPEEPDGIGFIP